MFVKRLSRFLGGLIFVAFFIAAALILVVFLCGLGSVILHSLRPLTTETLITACRSDDLPTIEKCVAAGIDLNEPHRIKDHGSPGYTPLTAACEYGRPSTIRYLIAHGADVNLRGLGGVPPLLIAAYKGRIETCRLLVEAGADVNAADVTGNTALDVALDRQRTDVVAYLRSLGAHESHDVSKADTD